MKTIPNDKIILVFHCTNEECPNHQVEINLNPTVGFFENGTPICSECGDDLALVRTAIEETEPTLVTQSLNGIQDVPKLFSDHLKAEGYFLSLVKEANKDLTEDELNDVLNEGQYVDDSGVEFILCQPENGDEE